MLAAHLPAYTAALTQGVRGAVPTPLVLGPSCVGRVTSVAEDVFNVEPGDVVVNGLVSTGDVVEPEEILIGWTGVGGRGATTEKVAGMQALWRHGTFAERVLLAKESVVRLPGAEDHPEPARLAFLPWLSIAAEGLNRAEQRAGQSVAILGATGQLGTAALLVALAQGRPGGGRRPQRGGARPAGRARPPGRARGADRGPGARRGGDHRGGRRRRRRDRRPRRGAGPRADAGRVRQPAQRRDDGADRRRTAGSRPALRRDHAAPRQLRGSWMCLPATALAVWRMVAAGTLDLSVLDVRTVGFDDPAAAIERAGRRPALLRRAGARLTADRRGRRARTVRGAEGSAAAPVRPRARRSATGDGNRCHLRPVTGRPVPVGPSTVGRSTDGRSTDGRSTDGRSTDGGDLPVVRVRPHREAGLPAVAPPQ
ncbi:zinc-binding alcohol dehydrogenase family protein [Streptomyces sp. M19]